VIDDQDDPQQPESLADLLVELRDALRRYVILPSGAAYDAVTLWIAASHGQAAWEHAPRLVIKAPEKRCGKSRLLDVIEATCHAPLMAVHVSAASIYRAIGAAGESSLTLLVDEADALFGPKTAADNEDLRGLLNAGHQRNRRVPRWNANLHKLEQLETFAFAALAGIGDMPDTIEDRAVVVPMRRRMAGEEVDSFRQRRDGAPLKALGLRLAAALRDHMEYLQTAVPEMPVEDRAADTWEPLVALAELASEDWRKAAHAAAVELTNSAAASTEPSPQLRLLADCREVLKGREHIGSTALVNALREIPDSGWDTYGPTGLSAKRLASMLAVYGIGPAEGGKSRRWPDGTNSKGYVTDAFTDAWRRYLPTEGAGDPSQPSQGQQDGHLPWSEAESARDGSESRDGLSVTRSRSVTARKAPLTRGDAASVTVVTDVTGTASLCRVCGERMTYDDGSGTHPDCGATL
jgi:hypothetical protein